MTDSKNLVCDEQTGICKIPESYFGKEIDWGQDIGKEIIIEGDPEELMFETKIKSIDILTMDNCPWCVRAKKFLDNLNLKYTEKKLGSDFTYQDLIKTVGEKPTLPQIYINTIRVGGCIDMENYFETMENTNCGFGNG